MPKGFMLSMPTILQKAGAHTVRWVFMKDAYNDAVFEDCAWLSGVKWTPDETASEGVVIEVNGTTVDFEALKRPGAAEPAKAGDAVVVPKQAGSQGFYKVWVSDAPIVSD